MRRLFVPLLDLPAWILLKCLAIMLMVVANIQWLCLSADSQNLKKKEHLKLGVSPGMSEVNYFKKKNASIIMKSLHIVMKNQDAKSPLEEIH